jgi:hypothetical protein
MTKYTQQLVKAIDDWFKIKSTLTKEEYQFIRKFVWTSEKRWDYEHKPIRRLLL